MTVDLFRWQTVARRFQEVIAAAVESFSRQGRTFELPQERAPTAERTHSRASFARPDGSTRGGEQ